MISSMGLEQISVRGSETAAWRKKESRLSYARGCTYERIN